jgi:hypothetical protein
VPSLIPSDYPLVLLAAKLCLEEDAGLVPVPEEDAEIVPVLEEHTEMVPALEGHAEMVAALKEDAFAVPVFD